MLAFLSSHFLNRFAAAPPELSNDMCAFRLLASSCNISELFNYNYWDPKKRPVMTTSGSEKLTFWFVSKNLMWHTPRLYIEYEFLFIDPFCSKCPDISTIREVMRKFEMGGW